MFREIRTREYITEEDRRKLKEERERNLRFLNIKPNSDITTEECDIFWKSIFKGEA